MTKRQKYEAFIATIPEGLRGQIDADAQDNAFDSGPATSENDDRFDCALATAQMMVDDPAPYGFKL